jgi:hypothetical protein
MKWEVKPIFASNSATLGDGMTREVAVADVTPHCCNDSL